MDIYSLGLVLVEIIKWRPMRQVFVQSTCERNTKYKKLDDAKKKEFKALVLGECNLENINNMRMDLLDTNAKIRHPTHPTDIDFKAGSIIGEVIRWCLSDKLKKDFLGDDKEQELQEAFFRNVLKPLSRCAV